MVTGLRRVSWGKVDVSFHSSMTSFAAHSIIQVCSPLLSFQHPPLCWLSCDARLTAVEAFYWCTAGEVRVHERGSGCDTAHNRPLPALDREFRSVFPREGEEEHGRMELQQSAVAASFLVGWGD